MQAHIDIPGWNDGSPSRVESVEIRHTESFIRLSTPESFLLSLSVLFSLFTTHNSTQHELNLLSSARNQRNTKNSNKFKLNLFIFKITKSSNLRHSHFSVSFSFSHFSLFFFLLTISIPIFNFRVFNFSSITAFSVLYWCYLISFLSICYHNFKPNKLSNSKLKLFLFLFLYNFITIVA
jgi:hypothetical protein